MHIGYGVGGGATGIESTQRRWLAVLLAFLLGAAMVLVVATPANAIHDPHAASLSVDYTLGDCKADVTFTHPADHGDGHHRFDIVQLEIRLQGGGATLTSIIPPAAAVRLEPGESHEVLGVSVPAGEYSAEAFARYGVAHETDPVGGANPIHGFETVTSASFTVDCEIEGEGYTGEITCEGSCTVGVNPNSGAIADLGVATTNPFVLVIVTDDKGPSPGKASVEVLDNAPKFEGFLPKCGEKGTEPTTNCVHINRVNGNHTEYTIFFDDDPRFKFR